MIVRGHTVRLSSPTHSLFRKVAREMAERGIYLFIGHLQPGKLRLIARQESLTGQVMSAEELKRTVLAQFRQLPHFVTVHVLPSIQAAG
ncbi:MAG: hypothetical protein WA952_17845 [Lewinella sp.]